MTDESLAAALEKIAHEAKLLSSDRAILLYAAMKIREGNMIGDSVETGDGRLDAFERYGEEHNDSLHLAGGKPEQSPANECKSLPDDEARTAYYGCLTALGPVGDHLPSWADLLPAERKWLMERHAKAAA